MRWDFKDQLQATSRADGEQRRAGDALTTSMTPQGQRVRKVTERQPATGQTPTRRNERIYLGGFEMLSRVRRQTATRDAWSARPCTSWMTSSASRSSRPARKATTAHRRNSSATNSAIISVRAALELDDSGNIISYEEYYPYGSTSYQAGRSVAEVSLKRYRYTGKERDEETGLNYHGARYYAPGWGGGPAPDPAGISRLACHLV